MKRFVRKLIPILAMTIAANVALAAENVVAKVTAVEGEKVSVTADSALPAWVKKDAAVQAMGWETKIVDVQGNDLVLEFNKAKAANIKIDSEVIIREKLSEAPRGCA